MTDAVSRRTAPLRGKPPGRLLVHEVFRSVQGESTFAGLPCVFVRTAVCDLRCAWCDTAHAFGRGEAMSLDEIEARVRAFETPLVLVTGGEPLLQPESLELLRRLADGGFTVLLETSGAHDVGPVDPRVRVIMDVKCPGSGESERNRWANLEELDPTDELKFVVASRADFDWAAAEIRARRLDERFTVLLSPAFGLVGPRELAEWLLASKLRARMQLQLHKAVWGPDARGV